MKQITGFAILLVSVFFICCGSNLSDSDNNISNSNADSGITSDMTFSCKINGELWEPTSGEYMIQAQQVFNDTENALTVTGIKGMNQNDGVMERFHLKVFGVSGPGNHEALMYCGLTRMGSRDGTVISDNFSAQPGTGHVNITAYDRTAKRVSGNFNFQMKHNKTGEVVTVTDGEFSNVLIEEQRM